MSNFILESKLVVSIEEAENSCPFQGIKGLWKRRVSGRQDIRYFCTVYAQTFTAGNAVNVLAGATMSNNARVATSTGVRKTSLQWGRILFEGAAN